MSNIIKGVINSKEKEININQLVNIVSDLKWYYYDQYHIDPKYIKLPIWTVLLLKEYIIRTTTCTASTTSDDIGTFMGLKICETKAISEITDIEVF